MRKHYLLFVGALWLTTIAQAQSWRAVIELEQNTEVPFCDAVQNGIATIPPALANSTDYRTRLILEDTFFVNNAFAIEARMLNAEANGGITAFDPGMYLDACDLSAGATLMGDDWALPFTSLYIGNFFDGNLPNLVQDFSDWRVLRYVFFNNTFAIFIDNQLLYSRPYVGQIHFIQRLILRFKGSGLVDWVRLYDGAAQLIWEEDFSDCNNLSPVPDWRAQIAYTISPDTIVCRTEALTIAASASPATTWQWRGPNGFSSNQAAFTLSAVSPADTGYYVLDAVFANCIAWRDSVYVGITPDATPPTAFLGADTTLCLGETLVLGRDYPCASYRWQDGSADNTFTVTEAGFYSVRIEQYGQTYTDTIRVDYFPLPQVALGNDTTLCPGEVLRLSGFWPHAAGYLWENGSTDSIRTVATAGVYTLLLTDVCSNAAADTIVVDYFAVLSELHIGNDTTLCPGQSLLLDATDSAAISYLWQDGSTNTNFVARQPGLYTVALTDNCGNTARDSILIDNFAVLSGGLFIGRDTSLCPGESLRLDATNPAAIAYIWQDSNANPVRSVESPGTYTVMAMDNCGNTARGSMVVSLFSVLEETLDIGRDTSLCPGTTLLLNAFDPAAITYLWQDGSTRPELSISQPGAYTVTLGDNCGNTASNTIRVDYYETVRSVDLGPDVTLCEGERLQLNASRPGAATYLWQDGSANATFTVTQAGIYTVTVADFCGNTASDQVLIRFDRAPEADLGFDTLVCEGSVFRLDASANNATFYRWQDGFEAAIYPVLQPGLYTVRVGNRCGSSSATVRIDFAYCGPCRTGVPNAFSPDGDGINDRLEVFSECFFQTYDFRVFDRWGVQVFASQNPNDTWDGTFRGSPLKTGVYIWRLVYQADDGSTATLSGDCTLLR
ncbi:MAG TPA: gliding motility-associated C-terminal domain-containing protein [Saprospiraceae bacterium]|nr:gliding motility-associated C-terminal domain-containing protein [Saprospiraceae bacterium]HMP25898.1 gliding motility-associated C-terminal domain-containing protein [Saprospiraceae bacterium]